MGRSLSDNGELLSASLRDGTRLVKLMAIDDDPKVLRTPALFTRKLNVFCWKGCCYAHTSLLGQCCCTTIPTSHGCMHIVLQQPAQSNFLSAGWSERPFSPFFLRPNLVISRVSWKVWSVKCFVAYLRKKCTTHMHILTTMQTCTELYLNSVQAISSFFRAHRERPRQMNYAWNMNLGSASKSSKETYICIRLPLKIPFPFTSMPTICHSQFLCSIVMYGWSHIASNTHQLHWRNPWSCQSWRAILLFPSTALSIFLVVSSTLSRRVPSSRRH